MTIAEWNARERRRKPRNPWYMNDICKAMRERDGFEYRPDLDMFGPRPAQPIVDDRPLLEIVRQLGDVM